jgi:hypothetical protein
MRLSDTKKIKATTDVSEANVLLHSGWEMTQIFVSSKGSVYVLGIPTKKEIEVKNDISPLAQEIVGAIISALQTTGC